MNDWPPGPGAGPPRRPGRGGPPYPPRTAAPGPRRVPHRARRRPPRALRPAKVLLALVSALVLLVTGYGWATVQRLQDSLATADVAGGLHAPDGATDILLIGNDARTDGQGNPLPPEVLARLGAAANGGHLTDTIILVRIPNDGDRVVGISFPRDMYVQMPHNYGTHKINSAFARARNETAQRLRARGLPPDVVHERAVEAGRRFMVQTIEKLTGVGIDHYVEVNLLGFVRLTKAVGGVKVCLKRPVDDPYSGAHFPAGVQKISGADALAFVRQRHGLPRGGLDRIVRQQVFLSSLADKVLSAGILSNPSRIREIIEATEQTLVLDEGFDILEFATKMQGISAGDIRFVTAPTEGPIHTSEGFALAVDRDAVQRFVRRVIQPSRRHPPEAPPTRINVNVFNTTMIDGMAGRVSDTLRSAGFDVGTVANAGPVPHTIVRYGSASRRGAELVAEALGGLATARDPNLAPDQVEVYLDTDYTGPGRLRADGAGVPDIATGGGQAAATVSARQAESPVSASDVPCVY